MGIADEAALIAHSCDTPAQVRSMTRWRKLVGTDLVSPCATIPVHGRAKACGVVAYQRLVHAKQGERPTGIPMRDTVLVRFSDYGRGCSLNALRACTSTAVGI
jgi:hypothetical protein